MLDWEDLRHFLMLAREGTLSAAARGLGVDHATVARRVRAIERETGLKLVDRRARSYTLTDEGRRIAATAGPMEQAAFAVGRAVKAVKPGVLGEVTISAPPSLASALIAPQILRLHRQHPGIVLKLIGEKRTASLNRREADVALRLTRPAEPGLVARKIGSFGFGLYGAPAYLKDTPRHALAFIAYDQDMDDAPQQQWLTNTAAGHDIVLRSNDLETQAAAARSGLGLAVLPHFLGDADPRLIRCDWAPMPVRRDLWLVVHRDLRQAAAVRAVMEFLAESLKTI